MTGKLLALSLLAAAPFAFGDTPAALLRVDGKISASPDSKPAKPPEIHETKILEVHLSTLSQTDPGPLKVKCTFFARDLKNNSNVMEKEVTLNASLVKGDAVVSTPPETFKATMAHAEGGKTVTTAGNVKVKAAPKRVEASGHEYSGWGVEVYDKANKLLGKAYSASFLDPATKH